MVSLDDIEGLDRSDSPMQNRVIELAGDIDISVAVAKASQIKTGTPLKVHMEVYLHVVLLTRHGCLLIWWRYCAIWQRLGKVALCIHCLSIL